MSFSIDRTNINERMQQVRVLLSFIKSQESQLLPPTDTDEVKILRGLFYVHLYGAFEKSISEGIEAYLSSINGLLVKFLHLSPGFLPTALDSRFNALQNGDSKKWKKRVDFIDSMFSTEHCAINSSIFSAQLQNAWPEILEEILQYLGVNQPISKKHSDRAYLTEVVDKRNQVAHGRGSPLQIGRSGRSSDLELRYDALLRIINDFLDVLEQHFSTIEFVSSPHKTQYLDFVQQA